MTLEQLEAAVEAALIHNQDRYDGEPGEPARRPLPGDDEREGRGPWVAIDGSVEIRETARLIWQSLDQQGAL